MISSFDLEKLSALLKDFYTLTKIRITVFNDNFEEIASYPAQRAELCRLIRTDSLALNRCLLCDRNACKMALHCHHEPYLYQCHAGLTEAILPIRLEELVVGYLFFGHVFCFPNHEAGYQTIKSRCQEYQIDDSQLASACKKSPIISENVLRSAARLLSPVASWLCMERMATLRKDNLPVCINRYLLEHLADDLDVKTLCHVFGIGKTYLAKISKQFYGVGIAEHIRNLRIKRAQVLLTERPDLSINQIVGLCGFFDYNYFHTVFKRLTGTTPGKYRQNSKPPLAAEPPMQGKK